jgi:hypothetical protein
MQTFHTDPLRSRTNTEWCQPVFVLNLPNSHSTPERADGQAERFAVDLDWSKVPAWQSD